MTPSDRNLLFGILALQNQLVTRDQLIEAMQAWVQAKHRPLGELLRERGAMTPEDQAVLAALVQRHVARSDQDAERCLRALSLAPSAHSALAALDDPDVQTGMLLVGTSTAIEPNAASGPARAMGGLGGLRYRILRPHARGGLGEVFVAEDAELHREVALKEMQRGFAHEQHGRARFLMEAEITGRLEHPGVVPVYGLGAYPDGRPYYAMRFIRGESMKEAIDRFHNARHVGSFASLQFRQLLGRFIAVCNAIAYAHSRGVLHRDLKPSNVMLGPFGETLVVDWGLAKVVGTQREDKPGPDLADATLRPSSGSMETVAGAAVGTPAFMSPEQAEGKLDALGPATDVYSLGATLYGLLTGKNPIQGATAAELLERVRHGVITPMRMARPDVPKALEAVCLKAMSLRPGDRYPSAQDLAQDVERWLADEPVAVYREPWPVRAGRWARKHKPLVATAAAVLLTATFGLAIGTYFINAERNRTELARQGEEKQRIEAEKSAVEAREREAETLAVLEFVENKIFAAARPKDFEGGLGYDVELADAVKAALPFVEASFKDQPLIEARLRLTLGRSFRYLGKAEIALEQEEKARALFTLHHGPDHTRTLVVMNNLANTYRALGRYADALSLCEETLALMKAKFGPEDPKTLAGMSNLASSYLDLGRYAEAAILQEAILALRKAKLGPDHADTLMTMNNLAVNYSALGRHEEALKLHEKTLALYKAKLGPDNPLTLRTMNNLSNTYRDLGRQSEALKLREETLALRRAKLGPDHPETLSSMTNLASSYAQLGRHAEALQLKEETLALCKVKLGPDHPRTLMGMNNLANTYADLGRHDEALKLHEETWELRKVILGPGHPDTLWSTYSIALIHALIGAKSPEGGKETDLAMDWLRKAVAAGFKDVEQMKQDVHLDALRKREDFKKLIAELEGAKTPDKP